MGPTKSSCVVAHVFIPVATQDELQDEGAGDSVTEGLNVLSKQFSRISKTDRSKGGSSYNILGYVYVMFRNRAGATSGVYKYGPMPLDIYRNYREYSSKGKGIRQILEPFGYTKSNWPV